MKVKKRYTVLIVEDEPTIADMQSKKLKEAGFIVDIVHCGKEAIERLNNNEINLIILDHKLPDMDGLEVVNALGKRVNNIPVVITTASRDEHLATEIFKHGVANLVTKDTDLNYLNTLSEVAINSVERFRYEAKNHELQEQLNKQVAEIESLEISIRKFNEGLVQNKYGTKKQGKEAGVFEQPYGNLSSINTSRVILDAVEDDVLRDIVNECLCLLGTSSAIYEKNGDYALGIFSSGWCRLLDKSSRDLCNTEDNKKALDSKKWLCHESCLSDASKVSMETGNPVDIECHGGLRLYAIPILAGNELVGSINFGYGNPPKDPQKLQEIADLYNIDIDELREQADLYMSRPNFTIEMAKNRLHTSARLIGALVHSKKTEKEIKRLAKFPSENPNPVIRVFNDGNILYNNKASSFILDYWGCQSTGILPEKYFKIVSEALHSSLVNVTETRFKDRIISLTFAPIVEEGYVNVYGLDITQRKKAEKRLKAQYLVTRVMAEAITIRDAFSKILETICVALEWDIGEIWLIDQKENVLRNAEIWHIPSIKIPEFKAITKQITFPLQIGLPGRVWECAQPLWIEDVVSDTNFLRASVATKEGVRGAFGFPILSGSEVIGTINFFSQELKHPDKYLLDMMSAIGIQIGLFMKRKQAEELLHVQKKDLEQKNIALHEVLGQIELEKKQIKDNVIANAENLLLPIIQKLRLKGESRKYVKILQKNIQELTSSFGTKLAEKRAKLTSREIEICDMIKNGLTSKEIARLLNISLRTTEKHRANIRKKLGIIKKDISLTSFLKTL